MILNIQTHSFEIFFFFSCVDVANERYIYSIFSKKDKEKVMDSLSIYYYTLRYGFSINKLL